MSELDGQPAMAYRTGDAGYYGEDGNLYYEGRIDQQIKLHGYRIELGDIEANLLKLPGVGRAAVIPEKDGDRITKLAAYITRTDESIPDSYEGRKMIREGLKELLPAYMVPKRIVFLSELPLTANGKINKKALEGVK